MPQLSRVFATLVSLHLHTLVVRTAELFASQRIPDLPHIQVALARTCLEVPGFLEFPPALRVFVVNWIVERAQELAARLPNHSIPVERRLHSMRVVSDGWTSPRGTMYIHAVPLPDESQRIVSLPPSSFISRAPVWQSVLVVDPGDGNDDSDMPPLVDL